MILEKADFELLKKQGKIHVKEGLDFGAFSLDLRIEKLFMLRLNFNELEKTRELSDEEFLENAY